jgi:hypothetical protein
VWRLRLWLARRYVREELRKAQARGEPWATGPLRDGGQMILMARAQARLDPPPSVDQIQAVYERVAAEAAGRRARIVAEILRNGGVWMPHADPEPFVGFTAWSHRTVLDDGSRRPMAW